MYQLIWGGRLWSINVPVELDSTGACAYAQTFVVTGSHVRAMIAAMKAAFPGISYDDALKSGTVSGFGMSCRASPTHICSQTPRTLSQGAAGSHAASHSQGDGKRPPQGPKATSSLPGGHRTRVQMKSHLLTASQSQMLAKPVATPQQGGWMGSTTTTVAGVGGARHK